MFSQLCDVFSESRTPLKCLVGIISWYFSNFEAKMCGKQAFYMLSIADFLMKTAIFNFFQIWLLWDSVWPIMCWLNLFYIRVWCFQKLERHRTHVRLHLWTFWASWMQTSFRWSQYSRYTQYSRFPYENCYIQLFQICCPWDSLWPIMCWLKLFYIRVWCF